jgi:hypothetical protein
VYTLDLLSFLWLNVIGAVGVVLFSGLLQVAFFNKHSKVKPQPAMEKSQATE